MDTQTIISSYLNKNENFGINQFSRIFTNMIIFVDNINYNYILDSRNNHLDKTYIIIVDKNIFVKNKKKYIEKAININPFDSNKFAWCDYNYIQTYLNEGEFELKILDNLENTEIRGGFLINRR